MDDVPALQLRQPLHVLDQNASAAPCKSPTSKMQTIVPTFVHHDPVLMDGRLDVHHDPVFVDDSLDESSDGSCSHLVPAPAVLVPTMNRPDYFCKPSVEKMKTMTEEQLSQIDELEVGRYGVGSITWPGSTDVRCIDFDTAVCIERGSVAIYPDGERPTLGSGLNKEAVIRLHVKPSRTDSDAPQDPSRWQQRMKELTEADGNTFISYDLKVWTFRVPHFELEDL